MPINSAIYNVVSLAPERGGGGGSGGGGVGVYLWHFVVGVYRPVLLILTFFHSEKLSFSTVVFRSVAGRNYVINTYNGLKCKEKIS